MNACVCHAELEDTYLCFRCTNDLRTNLARVPGMVKDLNITAAKQDVVGQGTPESKATQAKTIPLPLNLNAAVIRDQLTAFVGKWTPEMAHKAAHHPDGPKFHVGLQQLLNKAGRAVDRMPERIHVGTCGGMFSDIECAEPVYAVKGDPFHQCKVCGNTIDVNERQRERILGAWDIELPLNLAVQALTRYGSSISYNQAQKWAQRGKIRMNRVRNDGKTLYDLRDLEAQCAAMKQRRQAA